MNSINTLFFYKKQFGIIPSRENMYAVGQLVVVLKKLGIRTQRYAA